MVRSVVLLSVVAVYASLLTVDAQKPNTPSSESLSNLLNYLKEHPLSESNGAVKPAATENVNHRHRNEKTDQAVADQLNPAKKEEKPVSEAEKNDPEMSKSATESGTPPPPANEQEQVEKETMDANDKAVPADSATPAAAVDAVDAAPAANADASPASSVEEASKEEEQEPIKEESDIAIATPMKLDDINKADITKEADAKNEVTRESINDPTKDALRETLRESLRQSVRESMKNNKSGESAKSDILASLRAANQILAQSNNGAAPAANNPPKDLGVALAGDAASSNPTDQNSPSTENINDHILPSGDSTVPQIAEPTNIPITNYDMSVTAGMIFTNGGSSMSAASASMSAPYSSGTASFSSSSSTLSSNQSSKTSSSSGRPSATSTNAAHSSGNTNNYSLMFIGFTIFMSNMITIGFLW